MSFLDSFRLKRGKQDSEAMLIGYLRVQTSKHLGLDVNSQDFLRAQDSATKIVQESFVLLLSKQTQQSVIETLSSVCSKRLAEAYGEYLVLLFTRFGIIQHAIKAGKVKPEEASLDIVNGALHEQIKRFLNQLN